MSSLNWAQGFEHIFTGESTSRFTSTYSHEDFDDGDLSGTDELDDVLLEDGYDDEDLLIDDDVDVVSNAVVGMESLTDVLSRHQLVGGMTATSARIFNKSMGHVMRDMPKHTYNYCASAVSFESGDSKSTNTNETKRTIFGKVKDFLVKMWRTIVDSVKSFFKWIYDNTIKRLINFFKKKDPEVTVEIPSDTIDVVKEINRAADKMVDNFRKGAFKPEPRKGQTIHPKIIAFVERAREHTTSDAFALNGKKENQYNIHEAIATHNAGHDELEKMMSEVGIACKKLEEAAANAPTVPSADVDANDIKALGNEIKVLKSAVKSVVKVVVKSSRATRTNANSKAYKRKNNSVQQQIRRNNRR